jgi:hypothetical protein
LVDGFDPPGRPDSIGQPLRSRPTYGAASLLLFSDGQVEREDLGEQVFIWIEAVDL